MRVTIYSKAMCANCDATKRRLDRFGVEYTEVRIDQDQEAFDYIVSKGFNQAPVVSVVDTNEVLIAEWSGLRPDLIKEHLLK